jgi:hypothetical protein
MVKLVTGMMRGWGHGEVNQSIQEPSREKDLLYVDCSALHLAARMASRGETEQGAIL